MKYTEANYNPSGRKSFDCVVRAIMKGTGQTWLQTYDGLCQTGREVFDMPNGKRTYHKYLEDLGWAKQPMPRFPDRTRYTVAEFADAHPRGTFIVSIANHLTVIIDGELFDTWNCGRKSVCNYWKKI